MTIFGIQLLSNRLLPAAGIMSRRMILSSSSEDESDVPISSTLVTLKTESDNTVAETPINVKLEPVEQYIAVSKKCHRSLK